MLYNQYSFISFLSVISKVFLGFIEKRILVTYDKIPLREVTLTARRQPEEGERGRGRAPTTIIEGKWLNTEELKGGGRGDMGPILPSKN